MEQASFDAFHGLTNDLSNKALHGRLKLCFSDLTQSDLGYNETNSSSWTVMQENVSEMFGDSISQ